MIPARLIRTVPVVVDPAAEALWERACALHPTWEHLTLRDPIDHGVFPLTSRQWGLCRSGAQRAGLVRLEALYWFGGVYIDSDVRVVHPFDPLTHVPAFAGYEDSWIVPDAVLGAQARHPAIGRCIDLALSRLSGTSGEPVSWQTDRGAWSTGPGVTTTILKGRSDVLLLGPDAFYPVHHQPRETVQQRLADLVPSAWTFAVHLWAGSWL
jgi:mannosyltransferase OCH1-like enzyme